jgi:hypothetical protein
VLHCNKCGHEWEYRGDKLPFLRAHPGIKRWTSCGICKANVVIKI